MKWIALILISLQGVVLIDLFDSDATKPIPLNLKDEYLPLLIHTAYCSLPLMHRQVKQRLRDYCGSKMAEFNIVNHGGDLPIEVRAHVPEMINVHIRGASGGRRGYKIPTRDIPSKWLEIINLNRKTTVKLFPEDMTNPNWMYLEIAEALMATPANAQTGNCIYEEAFWLKLHPDQYYMFTITPNHIDLVPNTYW